MKHPAVPTLILVVGDKKKWFYGRRTNYQLVVKLPIGMVVVPHRKSMLFISEYCFRIRDQIFGAAS
jgi:hypothetical protein